MAYKKCKCVYCGEPLDRNTEEWKPAPAGRYAHKKCFDDRQARLQEQQEEREYRSKIHEKVKEVCGIEYVKSRTEKQIKEYLSEGKTAKGIYKTLEYWYDIKHSDPSEAHGGIGIVPYVYGQAQKYWQDQTEKKQINAEIHDESVQIYLDIQKASPRQCNYKGKITKPKRRTIFKLD